MTGVVTSDKMTKTVVVEISRTYQHPLYKKVVHAHSHFKAHNELDAQMGDVVVIVESRPLSRDKRWVVEKIVRRQGEAAVTEMVVEDAAVEEPADTSSVAASAQEEAPAGETAGSETVEGE
jgi:small subunit ribosomal protein S17